MTTLLTSELIDRCHAGSRNKGFWDEVPPQGQQLMLVISELAESLEAHRKGKSANWIKYKERTAELVEMGPQYDAFQPVLFQEYLKDSVGDELADTYIRLCDFIGGFSIEMPDAESLSYAAADKTEMPVNYGESLIEITGGISNAWQQLRYSNQESEAGDYLAAACLAIEKLCRQQSIDLATHIDLKLRYNATRPAKHGKAY